MNNKKWDNFKRATFPEITDWTGDFNEYRFAPNAGKLPMKYYLFFTPFVYLLSSLGTNVMTFLLFGGLTAWMAYKKVYILAVIGLYISVQGLVAFIKNIKNWQLIKHTTFYDIWFREYPEPEKVK